MIKRILEKTRTLPRMACLSAGKRSFAMLPGIRFPAVQMCKKGVSRVSPACTGRKTVISSLGNR